MQRVCLKWLAKPHPRLCIEVFATPTPSLIRKGEKPDTFTGLALAPNEGRTLKGCKWLNKTSPQTPEQMRVFWG